MTGPWRPSTTPIDSGTFADLIARARVVVVHFWAPWNGYDRTVDRLLGPVVDEDADRVEFRSADVDDPGLTPLEKGLGVRTVPTPAFFLGGKLDRLRVGVPSTAEVRGIVAGLVEAPPA